MVRELCPVLLQHLLALPETEGAGREEGVQEGNACHVDLSALHWVTDLVPEHWESCWLLNCQGSTWGAEAVLPEACLSLGVPMPLCSAFLNEAEQYLRSDTVRRCLLPA